jgi:hypothetical protein
MFAEIRVGRFIGDLRNAEQSRHLGQYSRERAAFAQNLEHFGRRGPHQPANQFGPNFGRSRVDQKARLDLFRHEVQRFLIRLGLRLGEQRRHARYAERGIGLPEIGRRRRSEFGSHEVRDHRTLHDA